MATMLRVMLLFLEQKKVRPCSRHALVISMTKLLEFQMPLKPKTVYSEMVITELDPHLDIKGIHLTLAAN